MKLNPEAVRARKERARRTRQRVEVRGEDSGNALVAGREMDTADALASRAYIHALALALRRRGMAGTLDQLRLAVFADLTAGRDPLDRLTRPAPAGPSGPDPATPDPAAGNAAPADPRAPGAATRDAGGAQASGGPGEPADDDWAPDDGGATDQCNLGPKSRRHHKAKQAPGWKVEQPEPGVIRWTLPSGRVHTTRPTVYDPCA
jgi:hypothetical protein